MPHFEIGEVSRRGSALLLVLGVVSLLTILVVAFLVTARTEFSSSTVHSRGVSAKLLSETAINTVITQISQATKTTDVLTGSTVAWVSQPGMIRTYDTTGNASSYYKLYSWDNMDEEGIFDPSNPSENAGPNSNYASWATQPDVFTDLNQPMNGIYPVISGADAAGNPLAAFTAPNAAGTKALTYESNGTTPDVEGFWVDPANTPTTSASDPNPVPMPVKWLYVLQDGTLVPGTSNGTTGAVIAGAAGKRVLGRIAFWTDDETAKVNINTASEGIFWDAPVCASQDEMNLSANPPVENEFQRVPGHPATTCLSSVFGNIPIDHDLPITTSLSTLTTNLATIYGFTPRISMGGSLGGTYPMSEKAPDAYTYSYAPSVQDVLNMTLPTPITPDGDRLFDNVDEALFQGTAVSTGGTRTQQDTSLLTKPLLNQDKFFLTASSRAPEVTLFNTPRISLWPITWPYPTTFAPNISLGDPTQPLSGDSDSNNNNNPWMVPKEQLLAFCASLKDSANPTGSDRYFFQRQNPDSPTYDYTIQRNKDLLGTYLRTLMGQNIPGMGASFNGKYGQAGSDYLLVNAFDFIRGAINLTTNTTDVTGNTNIGYNFSGYNFRLNAAAAKSASAGVNNNLQFPANQVVPMVLNLGSKTVKGYGQFPTITEAVCVFYASARNDPAPGGIWDSVDGPSHLITYSKSQTTRMTMALLVNLALPTTNTSNLSCLWIKATGASFQVNGSSIGFPSSNGNVIQIKANQRGAPIMYTGCYDNSISADISGNYSGVKTMQAGGGPGSGSSTVYQFVSNPITVDPNDWKFTFSGTPVTFSIYTPDPALGINTDPTTTPSDLVQTEVIDFSKCAGYDSNHAYYATPLAPRWAYGQPLPAEATQPNPATETTPGNLATAQPYVTNSQFLDANGTAYTGAGIYGGTGGNLGSGNDREVSPGVTYVYQYDGSHTISADWRTRLAYGIQALSFPNNNRYYYPDATKGPYSNPYQGGTFWGAQAIGPYDTCFSMNVDAGTKPGTKGDPRVLAGLETVTDTPSSVTEYFKNSFKDYNAPSMGNFYMNENGAQSYLQGCNSYAEGPHTSGFTPYTTPWPRTTAGAQQHALSFYGDNSQYEWASGMPYLDFGPGVTDKISLFNIPTAAWGQGGGQPYLLGNSSTPGTYTYGGYPGEVGVIAFGLTENLNTSSPPGDFMNNFGNNPDGGFIIYPDQNFQTLGSDALSQEGNYTSQCWMPFFQNNLDYGTQGNVSAVLGYFSPNREVASPIVLGSIPEPDLTGNGTPQPWTTLLFCPNPVTPSSGNPHPGFGSPNHYPPYTTIPDHLFLDLFWMPVVEPYPISEAFSTAGKINLNYQIVPFTYVNRETGLYAVMKSTKVTAIPSTPSTNVTPGSPNMIADYKNNYILRKNHPGIHTRFNIDTGQTLQAFDAVFAKNDLFRSSSQICEMFLVPQGQTLADVSDPSANGFWATQALTGANSREAPYTQIYPRVTTKSNTFQVHFRVQVLTQTASDVAAGVFDSTKGDSIGGEYRGSSIIERYIDPNASIPDLATAFGNSPTAANTLDGYYKFRVLNTTAFNP